MHRLSPEYLLSSLRTVDSYNVEIVFMRSYGRASRPTASQIIPNSRVVTREKERERKRRNKFERSFSNPNFFFSSFLFCKNPILACVCFYVRVFFCFLFIFDFIQKLRPSFLENSFVKFLLFFFFCLVKREINLENRVEF